MVAPAVGSSDEACPGGDCATLHGSRATTKPSSPGRRAALAVVSEPPVQCRFPSMNGKASDARPVVFTIGHSTRDLDDFLRLPQLHRVEAVVDVRTVPRSRRNPRFSRGNLPAALQPAGIGHLHICWKGRPIQKSF